jgi:hypothetical protein
MILPKIFLAAIIISISQAAITVNQISGISNDNLVFSGTIPVGSNNLFFTYYGVDGQKDQASLKNFPLLIFVGK